MKLTSLEFETLEKHRLTVELQRSTLNLHFAEKQNLELTAKVLELKREIAIRSLANKDAEMSQIRSSIEKMLDAQALASSKVTKRLKIKGRFGYDPETLEVIPDTKR